MLVWKGDYFMKKFILILITIIVAFVVYVNVNAEVGEIVIPEAAIRVRVIANSNSIYDQSMKMKVKAMIEESISPALVDVDNVEEAREVISEQINQLESDIEVLFDDNEYNMDYSRGCGFGGRLSDSDVCQQEFSHI